MTLLLLQHLYNPARPERVRTVNSFFLFLFFWSFETRFLKLALVDQAGLEFTEICLSLPPECWD